MGGVDQSAEIAAARHDPSVSRILRALLKEHISVRNRQTAEAAERLANFDRRRRLSLRGLKIKGRITSAI